MKTKAYGRFFIKKNKNKLITLLVVLVLLFTSVGYSLLSDILSINGTTTVTNTVWSVHFVSNTIDDSTSSITGCSSLSSCAAVPTRAHIVDKLMIAFNTDLGTLNDYYEFTVDVTNDGEIDAMIYNIIKEGITNDNTDYLDYTVEYETPLDDSQEIRQYDILESGDTITIKVKVKVKATPSSSLNVNFMVQPNYIDADANAVERELYTPYTPTYSTTGFFKYGIAANNMTLDNPTAAMNSGGYNFFLRNEYVDSSYGAIANMYIGFKYKNTYHYLIGKDTAAAYEDNIRLLLGAFTGANECSVESTTVSRDVNDYLNASYIACSVGSFWVTAGNIGNISAGWGGSYCSASPWGENCILS